jgi:ABC-2 type transport system ATP-binding protein
MEEVFQHWIRKAKDEGSTVLLSSHILAEVEALCDRVSIIRAGRTVQTGSLADLRHLTSTTVRADTERPAEGLELISGVSDLTQSGHHITFQVDTDHLDAAMVLLSGLGLRTLQVHPPTLEELFLTQYGDRLPQQAGSRDTS